MCEVSSPALGVALSAHVLLFRIHAREFVFKLCLDDFALDAHFWCHHPILDTERLRENNPASEEKASGQTRKQDYGTAATLGVRTASRDPSGLAGSRLQSGKDTKQEHN